MGENRSLPSSTPLQATNNNTKKIDHQKVYGTTSTNRDSLCLSTNSSNTIDTEENLGRKQSFTTSSTTVGRDTIDTSTTMEQVNSVTRLGSTNSSVGPLSGSFHLPTGLSLLSISSQPSSSVICTPSNADPEKREKMFNLRNKVAVEIMKTEEYYVRSQQTLSDIFIRSLRKVLSEQDIDTLFSNIEVILKFNSKFNDDVKDRVSNWEKDSVISDQFINFAPFFKMYTQYVANHGRAIEFLNTIKKQNKFQKVMATIMKENTIQDITSYLIMPIQRIPRYKLQLTEQKKNTPQDHPDYINTGNALDIVNRVAVHVNDAIKIQQQHAAVVNIKNQFSSNIDIVIPSRRFIYRAPLIKKCRARNVEYEFILFNDLLQYASYTVGHTLKLHRMLGINNSFYIQDLEDLKDEKNRIQINTAHKSFIVMAKTPESKQEWLKHLKLSIQEKRRTRQSGEDNGTAIQAPVWKSDYTSTQCNICSSTFTMFKRRHHCRVCGNLVCGECSKTRLQLPYSRPGIRDRVCDLCLPKVRSGEYHTSIKSNDDGYDTDSRDGIYHTTSSIMDYGYDSDVSDDDNDNNISKEKILQHQISPVSVSSQVESISTTLKKKDISTPKMKTPEIISVSPSLSETQLSLSLRALSPMLRISPKNEATTNAAATTSNFSSYKHKIGGIKVLPKLVSPKSKSGVYEQQQSQEQQKKNIIKQEDKKISTNETKRNTIASAADTLKINRLSGKMEKELRSILNTRTKSVNTENNVLPTKRIDTNSFGSSNTQSVHIIDDNILPHKDEKNNPTNRKIISERISGIQTNDKSCNSMNSDRTIDSTRTKNTNNDIDPSSSNSSEKANLPLRKKRGYLTAHATMTYISTQPGDLTFTEGTKLNIFHIDKVGWCIGRLDTGETGVFPLSYLSLDRENAYYEASNWKFTVVCIEDSDPKETKVDMMKYSVYDYVCIEEQLDDGMCYGYNINTDKSGQIHSSQFSIIVSTEDNCINSS